MLILFCCMRFKIASNAPGRLKDVKSAKNQNMNNIHDSLSNHFNMRWFYITTSMRCFDHKHLTPSLLVLILLIEDNSLGILTTISFTNKGIRKISHGFTFFFGLEGNIWLSRTMKKLIFCCTSFKIATNASDGLKDVKSAKNQF